MADLSQLELNGTTYNLKDAVARTTIGGNTLDTTASTLIDAVNEVNDLAQKAIANESDTFDATATYAEGEYCIHNGMLYVCTAEIETAGAWTDSTNWRQITISEVLETLRNLSTLEYIVVSDGSSSGSDDSGGTDGSGQVVYTVEPATTLPIMDGSASIGASANYARADHVHPTDTSRAPVAHASSATTYGKGTDGNYGHLKLSDAINSTSNAESGGIAATPYAVKLAYDLANGKPSLGSTAGSANGTAAVGTASTAARSDHVHPTDTSRAPTSHASSATTYGIGTSANYGHVKLSDSTSTTSGASAGIAATPTAVKAVADAKQDKNIYVTSKSVASSAFASNSTYSSLGYGYRAAIAITGVTASMFAEVVFAPAQALSGNYLPICETYAGGVYIYSKVNTAITIPTIAVFK